MKVELTVDGMSCGHCVRAVTGAIQALDPAARVEVTLESGTIRAETSLTAAQVAAAVAEEGYKRRA
jgi:copper chaperone